jgi:hypothetical protein
MAFMSRAQRNQYLSNFDSLQQKALRFLFPDPGVGIGAPAGSGTTAVETRIGELRKTVISVNALAQAVVNGTEYQSSKIYDFPLGVVTILSASFTFAQTTTSVIADTLNSGAVGAVSLGSAAASATTLSGAMANVAPSTAFASSATINVAGTAVVNAISTPATLNGSATASDLYLNTAYATTTDVDADATQTVTATITLIWMVN